MEKPQFIENQIYHIYNRGVEKRNIFLEDKDYFRLIHDLFEFNDENASSNMTFYFKDQTMEVEPPYLKKERKPRKLLVEILIFTLMPNHFHLLLKQKRENGIIRFMQKLGTGYSMYFNQKYERVGGLFQGSFKAVLVNEEAHFAYLPHYIHLNQLSLINYGGSTSVDWKMAMDFLENYRWSSFPDYIGKKNFPSITSREFLLEIFGGADNYKKETRELVKDKIKREFTFEKVKDIIIE
ncbi:MAG: transposase [Candidatus Portnoybacteria bacterium]|nr:transposase [Candidatus Portnoybacteria bacterium]